MKTALITGASQGIGLAIAKKFAKQFSAIAICSRDAAKLSEAAEILQQLNKNCRVLHKATDICVKEEVIALASFIEKEIGVPDVIVNNAGKYVPGPVQNENDDLLCELFFTNVNGAYRLTKMFLPGMIARKSGHIINICSTASKYAFENGGSYSVTKHALYGLSKVLREELKQHLIKVTAILPGATFTGSWQGSNLPADRFLQPEDVAEAVLMCTQLSARAVVDEIIMRPMAGNISDSEFSF